MDASIKFYKEANDLFNIKVEVENFFTFWLFYTLIPIFSAVFLVITWGIDNVALIGAMVLDAVSLIGIDSSGETYTVNWFWVGWIAFC